jgi:hypothetical protein
MDTGRYWLAAGHVCRVGHPGNKDCAMKTKVKDGLLMALIFIGLLAINLHIGVW